MALSWGPEQEPEPYRRRLGLRVSSAAAAVLGVGGEVAAHTVARSAAPVWEDVRLPLLGALALALSRLPVGWRRRTALARTMPRPHRSELARHIDRRTRRQDG